MKPQINITTNIHEFMADMDYHLIKVTMGDHTLDKKLYWFRNMRINSTVRTLIKRLCSLNAIQLSYDKEEIERKWELANPKGIDSFSKNDLEKAIEKKLLEESLAELKSL